MDKQAESESNQPVEVFPEENQPLLEKILKQKIEPAPARKAKRKVKSYPYSLIGLISTFDHAGYAVVNFSIEDKQYNVKANTTVELSLEQVGQQCLIVFNQGNIEHPIITGLIQQPTSIDDLMGEDKPIVIHSETGIILKCGSSRIELTEDGTINIQGMHINSQAYGPNRIKGGSVKIN